MDRYHTVTCQNCDFSSAGQIHNDGPQTPESIAAWDRFAIERITELHSRLRPHCPAPELSYVPATRGDLPSFGLNLMTDPRDTNRLMRVLDSERQRPN